MEVIRKAWTSEGCFSHHGKRWHYDNIVVEPVPRSGPTPLCGSPPAASTALPGGARGLQPVARPARPDRPDHPAYRPTREECEQVGRPYSPTWWRRARALQMFHSEANDDRRRVPSVIGDLARDKLPDRVEDDTAALLGTPAEVDARSRSFGPVGRPTCCWSTPMRRLPTSAFCP